MKINLKILDTAFVSSEEKCENLQEKILIENMMLRRRLTRGAKIAVYLASKVGYKNEKIVFGSAYGEVQATVNVLKSIYHKTALSPTAFQNSVHNTPVSYLSIISENNKEVTTVSDLFDTSLSVLKTAAIKSLKGDKILLLNVDAFLFDGVQDMNKCDVSMMEAGVGLLVEFSTEKANIVIENKSFDGISPSLWQMLEIQKKAQHQSLPIVEIEI
jgi:hypothetical protein